MLLFCQTVYSTCRPVRSEGRVASRRYAPSVRAGSVTSANGFSGRSDHDSGPRRVVAGLRQVHPERAGVRDRRDVPHGQRRAGRHPGRRPVGAGEVEAPVGGQAPAAQLPVGNDLPVPAVHVRHPQVVPRREGRAVRGEGRAARRRARALAALGGAGHHPAHRIRRRTVRPRRPRRPQGQQQRGHEGGRECGAVCGRTEHPSASPRPGRQRSVVQYGKPARRVHHARPVRKRRPSAQLPAIEGGVSGRIEGFPRIPMTFPLPIVRPQPTHR